MWEPRRVVPTYAVPVAALRRNWCPPMPIPGLDENVGARLPGISSRPILDPTVPFAAHSCAGTSFDVIAGDRGARPAAAFRPTIPDLADYVILDFPAFEWHEEDEPVIGHPHDPFSRIEVLRSSRHVRVELNGQLLAESDAADAAVRDAAAGAVLPAARGRRPSPSNPARRRPTARTRARRPMTRCPTGRATWLGRIPNRCTTPNPSAIGSASSTSASTCSSTVSGATGRSPRGPTNDVRRQANQKLSG